MAAIDQAGTIERCLVFLADRCDGAATRDGDGFNGLDTHFGHELAAVVKSGARLSFRQRAAAHKLLQKYAKQLASGGLDIKAEPAPDAAPRGVTARAPGTCAACGQAYEVGAEIRFLQDGSKRRIHADCEIADVEPDSGTTLNDPQAGVRDQERHLAAIRQETPAPAPADDLGDRIRAFNEAQRQSATAAPDPSSGARRQTRTGKTVRELLGPDGPIAKALPGYEHREEQIACAEAIEAAIQDGAHIAVEAGTGTGKSFMYLMALYNSGLRGLVSTADKNLQGQLWFKDAPFIKQVFPDFDAAILKGRANYLCLLRQHKLEEQDAQTTLDGSGLWEAADSEQAWQALKDWETTDGDIETVELMTPEVRREVTVTSDLCAGTRCKFAAECWANKARSRAEGAQVLIVNHHLTLLDTMIRQKSEGHASVLPDRDVIVLDEAHHLEDIATNAYAQELELYQWKQLAETFERLTAAHPMIGQLGGGAKERGDQWMVELRNVTETIESAYQAVEERFRPNAHGKTPNVVMLGDMNDWGRKVWFHAKSLTNRMKDATPFWLQEEEEKDAWEKVMKALRKHASELWMSLSTESDPAAVTADELDAEDDPNNVPESAWVRYAELNKYKKAHINRKPIEVAPILRESLFDLRTRPIPGTRHQSDPEDDWDGRDDMMPASVIATSATLAVAGSMKAWQDRVGMEGGREIVVGSPFDYMTNGRLYIPNPSRGFEPKYEGDAGWQYSMQIADEMADLTEAAGGRTFLLFTSNRQLQIVYNEIAWDLEQQGYQVLRQNQPGTTKASLIERFKERPSVLFGVASFWEGVDVQGDALSLVVIDKMPFPPHDDPIWKAREELVKSRGGDPFQQLSVPHVVIKLKQGAGRLIRNKTDRGAVAILDTRLRVKAYGATIRQSLPPMRPSEKIANIAALWPERAS